MNRRPPIIAAAAAACLAAAAACGPAAAQDKVYKTAGSTLTGEIRSTSPNEVVIAVRGRDETVPTDEVQRVLFDGEPSELTRAKESAALGQWEQAAEQIKAVDAAKLTSEAVKQDYQYYRALIAARLALAGQGNVGAAAGALRSYLTANPRSHHFYELAEVYGALAAAANSHAEAVKSYSAIGNAPFPAYKLKSGYLVGTALLADGKPAEARAEFEKVRTAAAPDPESQRYQKLAGVAAIRADIAAGQAAAAVDSLLAMVAEGDSTDSLLFGEIYNTLGEAHLKLEQPGEARLAYLHTDLLFPGDAENHAEALYHLAQLWEQGGEPQRATDARSRLKERYGNTAWARK